MKKKSGLTLLKVSFRERERVWKAIQWMESLVVPGSVHGCSGGGSVQVQIERFRRRGALLLCGGCEDTRTHRKRETTNKMNSRETNKHTFSEHHHIIYKTKSKVIFYTDHQIPDINYTYMTTTAVAQEFLTPIWAEQRRGEADHNKSCPDNRTTTREEWMWREIFQYSDGENTPKEERSMDAKR